MADLNTMNASMCVMVMGSDSMGNETNPLSVDTNGKAHTRLYDAAGVAIDTLNAGTGLNSLNVAIASTNYFLSVGNNTTTQLASGATFIGTIENVSNQQAISTLLTSDQNGILTLLEYIDAAGTRIVATLVYNIIAGIPFSRAVTANGNYFSTTFKNTGLATTTTLNLNIAYGTLPPVTSLGNEPMSLEEVGGVPMGARPDGFLRVTTDPTTLLFDTFEILDTTNTWTIGGTTPPSGSSGSLAVAPGTAAAASSYAISKPAFIPGASAYLQFATLIALEATLITGNQRFWGLGTITTPTLSVPIINGTIYELDNVTGKLFGSVYSNGIRTQTINLTKPSDSNTHRYAIYYKASRVFFEIDNVQVGTIPFPNPQVSSLQTVVGSVNGASALATATVLSSTLMGVADTGRNSQTISDATFPWRKQKINADGSAVFTQTDGYKATYAAAALSIVPATLATDIFTLTGSATRTIRILRVTVTGNQTTSSQQNILLVKRSTANTAGTSTASVAVKMDSNSPSATATALAYTANPTVGTLVGSIRNRKLLVGATSASSDAWLLDFGSRAGQAIVLRGINDVFAINLNGVTIVGGSFNIDIEWTEE